MAPGIQALVRTRFFLFADYASLITTSASSKIPCYSGVVTQDTELH